MGIYDRIYKEEHRTLSRIATYGSLFCSLPVYLILGFVTLWLGGFVFFGLPVVATAGGALIGIWLALKLWAKHSLLCPSCTKSFFGKFRVFKPYTDRCGHCGFCIIPDEPIKLDIGNM
jgi:hypothetical protein